VSVRHNFSVLRFFLPKLFLLDSEIVSYSAQF